MQNEFRAFLEQPTPASYRRVRLAMMRLPQWIPQATDLYELVELMAAEQFAAARSKVASMMPQWALSPRVHLLAAEIALALGDEEDAELEQFVADSCLQGLLGTGNGSRAFPYLVTHSSDEREILSALSREQRWQSLVENGTRRYDVVGCDDDSEIWFDVTDLMVDNPPVLSARGRAAERAVN